MKNRARIQMTLSAAVFGTIPLFVRNLSLASSEVALYRAVIAAILIGVCLIFSRDRVPIAEIKKELPLLLASGVAMGFNWILLFQAYRYTTVSMATLSYYFAPVLVTIACPILFHEKLTRRQILCFAMSTLGVVLIVAAGEGGTAQNHLFGICLGLGAAVLYATVVLVNKFIKNVGGIQRTFFQFLAAAVVLVPYVWCTNGFYLHELTASGWINLLILGLFHTGITYFLYFSSLKELPGQEAAVLSYIDPLVAIIVSVAILGESMTGVQLLGGVLVLGFALWNECGAS
ncbi:MAG: EamA family transporter [Oscillospiraceae bacterium]|nr:EamA family transporter [Oscillospiraceae bacterium]